MLTRTWLRGANRAQSRRLHSSRGLALESLEGRALLSVASGVEPTAEEQYMLQLINRARSDPQAEVQRLLNTARTDSAVKEMVRNWDLTNFARVLGGTKAAPPLAFNTRLIEAARDHDQTMLAANDQRHSPSGYLTDTSVARADDGQAYYPLNGSTWSAGENIFAFSANVAPTSLASYVDYFHAAFLIDWGVADFSHLTNVMAPGPGQWDGAGHRPYTEIGIGLLANAKPTTPAPANPSIAANKGLDVGPVLVTQEFGYQAGTVFLTGAIYADRDQNDFYTPGEGLGGITVQAVGQHGEGTFVVQTWASGGYSLKLPAGTYNVTASGAGLETRTNVVTIGADNVGWDIEQNVATPTANSGTPSQPAPEQTVVTTASARAKAQAQARAKAQAKAKATVKIQVRKPVAQHKPVAVVKTTKVARVKVAKTKAPTTH